MKNLILILGLIFILSPAAFAQEPEGLSAEIKEAINLDENIRAWDLGVGEPRVLPDSPLYFLKSIGRGIQSAFAFNSVDKAELKLKFSNEKLIEAKKLAETKPEILSRALENYKVETDRLKEAVEKIRVNVEAEKVDKFMDKFVDNTLKQQKLLGKFEKELPPEVYENIEEAKEENMAKFSDIGLKLVSAEVLQKKIVKAANEQLGSDFKQFKNLEVLQTVAEKVPEPAKPAIEQAAENSLKRLKGDLEKMSSEDMGKFKDYIENIGGNEARHLAIMDELEKEEIPQIIKEEISKAKEKTFERVELRLKEYEGKQLEGAKKEFFRHLTEQGGMEDVRIMKEMENNLSPEATEIAFAAKEEVKEKLIDNIVKAETPEQQKGFFEKIDNKYHDIQQLEVFKEIEELIPPEKKELYEKMKERTMIKIQEEIVRARMMKSEEKAMIINKLAGDSPEQIKILEEFKPPQELTQRTVEKISERVGIIEDPAKLEMLKNKLEGKEIKMKVVNIKPEIFEDLEKQLEISINVEMLKPAETRNQINQAKENISSVEKLFSMLSPELQKEFDKSSYSALMSAAKKHLEKAEKALQESNYGEAFGQAIASMSNSSNARQMIYKITEKEKFRDERMEKFKKWFKEVKEKFPELITGSISEKMVPSICPFPPIPSREACKGKWEGKTDSNGCPYFACVGEAKEPPCAGEGQKVNRDSSMGLTNQLCCANLREIKISQSHSICRKEVVGVECNVDVDCPQPLCSQKTSKCYEGKCFVPGCMQEVIPPREVQPTPTPTGTPCPRATKLEELIPATGSEGVCKKFISLCDIPSNWKRVDACPEPVFAPDMVGCCLEGAKECIQAPKEKCQAEGGQAVPAWSCNIANTCFYLAAVPKAMIAPLPSLKAIPSDLIACCMNYSCNHATREVCAASGGREIGPALECDTTYICGQVGCCFEGGICKPMIQKDCLLGGGKPYGSSCSPNQCPISLPTSTPIPISTPTEPMTACCLERELCMYETKEHCLLKNGKQVSSCSSDLCPTPIPTSTPTPYYISCKEGNMKDHRCFDGTMVSWQCQCLNVKPDATAYSLWSCVLKPMKFCPASISSVPLVITEIEIRHYFSSMQFFWSINEPALSYMEYGPTTSYGFRAGGLSGSSGSLDTPGTQFVVEGQHLSIGTTDDSKLRRDTLYHFRIIAKDAKGNKFVSDDYTFSTVPECLAGTVRNYQCSNGTLIDWCKCASEKKWDCISSPESACPTSVTPQPIATECKAGEIKQYKCSDGSIITACKCAPEGKWDCLPSPEKSCPVPATTAVPTATLAPTAITECKAGEIKQYKCSDGTSVTSCKCTSEGKWDCLVSPETACPAKSTATVTPLPAGVECKSGETKDYICPDGTRISPWCDCPDWANGKWNCDLQMWVLPIKEMVADPSSISKLCPSPGDTTPPVISNIKIPTNTSPKLVQITCDTDEPAHSWLEYGITTSYGYKIEPEYYLKTSQHTPGGVVNLQPNTTYHFRVVAKDLKGNIAYSDDNTFTTGL